MDADKLSKAALAHCEDFANGTYKTTVFDVLSGFKDGADWLMQQPLADRLTDEEKEKIIKRYNDELEMARLHTEKMKESTNPTSRQFHANVRDGYIARLKLIEQLFGKDLFNDNPEMFK